MLRTIWSFMVIDMIRSEFGAGGGETWNVAEREKEEDAWVGW